MLPKSFFTGNYTRLFIRIFYMVTMYINIYRICGRLSVTILNFSSTITTIKDLMSKSEPRINNKSPFHTHAFKRRLIKLKTLLIKYNRLEVLERFNTLSEQKQYWFLQRFK